MKWVSLGVGITLVGKAAGRVDGLNTTVKPVPNIGHSFLYHNHEPSKPITFCPFAGLEKVHVFVMIKAKYPKEPASESISITCKSQIPSLISRGFMKCGWR